MLTPMLQRIDGVWYASCSPPSDSVLAIDGLSLPASLLTSQPIFILEDRVKWPT
jgi:hypothetical protein